MARQQGHQGMRLRSEAAQPEVCLPLICVALASSALIECVLAVPGAVGAFLVGQLALARCIENGGTSIIMSSCQQIMYVTVNHEIRECTGKYKTAA